MSAPQQPGALFYVGIYCDAPGCEEDSRHDIMATDLPHAYRVARVWLMEHAGWSRVRNRKTGQWLDLCPAHRPDPKEIGNA